eukprot:2590072-Alexandrium_andersonii.AAC.1
MPRTAGRLWLSSQWVVPARGGWPPCTPLSSGGPASYVLCSPLTSKPSPTSSRSMEGRGHAWSP